MTYEWQPITCETVYPTKGPPRPCRIVIRRDSLRVIDLGRNWEAEDGMHWLARTDDGATYELRHQGGQWWARVVALPITAV
ncbi:MAG: hypothetical protein Kow0077_31760 [Anaerolineae bacterium]